MLSHNSYFVTSNNNINIYDSNGGVILTYVKIRNKRVEIYKPVCGKSERADLIFLFHKTNA